MRFFDLWGSPNENGDNVYAVIIDITMWVYLLETLFMLVVLGLVIRKRGNWFAIFLTVLNLIGYFLKGVSFSPFTSDNNQTDICYLDCH